MIQQAFQILIAVTFLCSCQSTTKVWTSDHLLLPRQLSVASLNFPQGMSSEQIAEDIDFLIFSLTKGYGGRQHLPENSFSKAIETLRRIPKTSSMPDFHEQIDDVLFMIPDNHLVAYYKGRIGKKRQAYQQETTGHVGKNNISHAEKVWEVRTDRAGKKNILYIAITRFPDKEQEVWRGFIPAVTSKMKSSDLIVIDLRGNTGGDDAKGMELAQLLYGHAFEHPIKRQFRSQTPETLALLVNRSVIEIENMKYDGQDIPDYAIKNAEEFKRIYVKALKNELPPEDILTSKGIGSRAYAVTGYKKPIYILMDRSCGSSCEFTVSAFEWHPYAKRVGENTQGTFHFSNVGIAVLPNSKFKVMVPSQYNEYYDHRFIEREGLSPHLKVSQGSDAYGAVKKIIGR